MNSSQEIALQSYANLNAQTRDLTKKRQNQDITATNSRISGFAWGCFSLLDILSYITGSSLQVMPNYDVIVSHYGVVTQILREPGFYWLNGAGLETKNVFIGSWMITLTKVPVINPNALPYFVSATCNYRVIDSLEATFKTLDFHSFVKTQAEIALQKIYCCHSNSQDTKIKKRLNEYVKEIGVLISSFTITGVFVSQEIQELTLAKTKAAAYFQGRKIIARGAILNLESTLEELKKNKIELTEKDKSILTTNFIYLICKGEDVELKFLSGVPSLEELLSTVPLKNKILNNRNKHES